MLADQLLGDLDRPEQAYALGVTAASGRLDNDALVLRLPGDGQPLLSWLRHYRESSGARFKVELGSGGRGRLVSLRIGPKSAEWLGTAQGPLTQLSFPDLNAELKSAFCRGLLDAGAEVTRPDQAQLEVRLRRPGQAVLDGLVDFTGVVPSKLGGRAVHWTSVGALDLLGLLYDRFLSEHEASSELLSEHEAENRAKPLYRPKLLRRYISWCRRMAHISSAARDGGSLWVRRLRDDAVLPGKGRVSDSGYDLTILHVVKTHGNITLFGTGLSIEPPQGWYFDVIARSSLIKLGYIMANSVGVIDRAYRGEVMVPLVKVDPNAPDIALPARVAQLIPRPIVHFPVVERSELSGTHRGSGGFGSTGPA